ncbi:MAG TPA: undecaprenyl-phosphate glucose phosphotransferase [Thermodesulfobacteriota bacterium]
MVKEHQRFFRSLLLGADIAVIAVSWGAAYWMRFKSGLVSIPPPTVYNPDLYLMPLAAIPIVWPAIFRWLDLYRPRRSTSYRREALELFQGSTLATLVFITAAYLFFKVELSRLVLVFFWGISTAALVATRIGFREALRILRRRGFNLRYALVVGGGDVAAGLVERIDRHPELGLRVVGLLSSGADLDPVLQEVPRLGGYDDLSRILREWRVDQVLFALPLEDQASLPGLLAAVDSEMVDVRIVPDLLRFASLRSGVEDFDGLPIVSLRTSPLVGWNVVIKRALDLAVGSLAGLLALPLMAVIALLVKLTDGGPVLYRQERMGLDGRVFQMLKFRSMRVDAEAETGPVWARNGDSRVTWIGRILRRTSLDELPQLWNVLKGEMSLTGPRPERPVLVERFRAELPGYMLRHKIKAGMTGWAQVHGWRGDTSLEKRLEHDLYYIEHWSLALDLKILWLTLWRGFVNKNAY